MARTWTDRISAIYMLLVAALPFVGLSLPSMATGQELPGLGGSSETAAPEAAPTPVPAGLASPRATMTTFLEAMNALEWDRAIATLDMELRGAGELLGARLASLHNLRFYLRLMRDARRHIEAGSFSAFREAVAGVSEARVDRLTPASTGRFSSGSFAC